MAVYTSVSAAHLSFWDFSAGISTLLKVQPQNRWMYVPGTQIKSFHTFSSPWQSTLIDYSERLWSRKRLVELQLPSTLHGVVVATDKCARFHSDWHSRPLWEKDTHAWLVFVVTLNMMFPPRPLWVVTSSSYCQTVIFHSSCSYSNKSQKALAST